MDADALIESTLEGAVARSEAADGPPRLAAAIRHAVFPGGARVRPQLCLATAHACDPSHDLTAAAHAGAAIELMHCASLVHDDLPCFDGAAMRRGKPSVHVVFGEALAVLAGDALIVMAFSALADAPPCATPLSRRLAILSDAAGPPHGIVAGQAWESEDAIDLKAYHRAKTGALFVAAAMSGAAAVGQDPMGWRTLGDRLGEAYQVADDIRDMALDSAALGKPAGQDALNDRPNAVAALGLRGALAELRGLIEDAVAAIPDCPGAPALRSLVRAQSTRLMPESLLRAVA